MRLLVVYFIGLIFGLGIVTSGMANPAKVLNFFDVAGSWDPSLALVMVAALLITYPGYRLVFGNQKPLFEEMFHVPVGKAIDTRLIGGSVLFGVGWGVTGFCPGGALPAIGTGKLEVLAFVAAMATGILAARLVPKLTSHFSRAATAPRS